MINLRENDVQMTNIADEIIKTIKYAIDRKTINCDRTYRSVIKGIMPKGYVILDDTGSERTVQCCIPNTELKVGQSVWLKEPMGDLKGLHICGVINQTGNRSRR